MIQKVYLSQYRAIINLLSHSIDLFYPPKSPFIFKKSNLLVIKNLVFSFIDLNHKAYHLGFVL